MRKLGVAVAALILVTSSAEASERFSLQRIPSAQLVFEPLEGSGHLPRLVAEARAFQSARAKGLTGNAIVAESTGQTLLIAAAANTPGGFDSFFTSDVTLAHLGDGEQDIAIFFLSRGQDNRNAPGTRATLPDAPPSTIENILGQLGVSGIGSLLIIPITGAQQPTFDPDSSIDAYSRLLTPAGAGEASQSFPATYTDFLAMELAALALGHRQDANFRVNAGVVNLSESAQNFLVTVVGEASAIEFVIAVPPFSMNQVPIPAGSFGALALLFEPEDDVNAFEWIGYAASNDNRSGDSWSSFAGRIVPPEDFAKQP